MPLNFVEVPARHLHDNIVQRRLEEGRGALRDLVLQFVEAVADGQLRRDLGDRITRRLRSERRGTRHPRVDLDDDDLVFVVRVDGKLDVATAREIADPVHALDGQVAHLLVGRIRQGHGRGHGDRIARMDTHRIEVLDRTDDDHVSGGVAQQLEFELLPTENRLLDQHLVYRGSVQAAVQRGVEFFPRVHETTARAAQRKRRTNHQRKADLLGDLLAFEK